MIAEPQRSAGAAGAGEFPAQEGGVLPAAAYRSAEPLWDVPRSVGQHCAQRCQTAFLCALGGAGLASNWQRQAGGGKKKRKLRVWGFSYRQISYKNKGVYERLCFPANIYTN